MRFSISRFTALLVVAGSSGCASFDSPATGSEASIKITKPSRVSRPKFSKIDQRPVRRTHRIKLPPGTYDAELLIKWPDGPQEAVAFPLEIPKPGNYLIQAVSLPKRPGWPAHTGPLETKDAFEGADPKAVGLLLPFLLPIHMGAVLVENADHLDSRTVRSVVLRLRADREGSRVISWKVCEHPSWRRIRAKHMSP